MRVILVCLLSAVLLVLTPQVKGHGYMAIPPGRSSAWRMNGTNYFRVNYNDNQNYCGGYNEQHNSKNKGRCGICGDDFSLKRPRDNERGGWFDTGNTVALYRQGETIDIAIVITANHKGRFIFELCPMNNPKQWEEEKCFITLKDADTGRPYYKIPHGNPDTFLVRVKLPPWQTCKYCVLRWKYITANSWGCGDDWRTCCTGCGNKQEHFYSCADIRITETGSEEIPPWNTINPAFTTTPRPTTTRYPSATTTLKTTTTTTTTTKRPTRRPVWPTRRPVWSTRRPRPTTTTTTTTESPICSQWCSSMCKPHFQKFCTGKLCSNCLQFRRYIQY